LDGTLGLVRPLTGPVYTIQQTDGTTIGGNLFHSFGRFNVATGEQTIFQSGVIIRNIFARVTGGFQSSIDGTITTNNSGINVFLLNPTGILFGRNARLQVSGSFVASTANSFVFSDGSQFSAIAPQSPSLLAISVPIGLQFGSNPGPIQVLGNGRGLRRNEAPPVDTNEALRVQPNRTLALIGGPVNITGGTLKTAGGRLELGTVAGAEFVGLDPIAQGFSVNYDRVSQFGNIQLTQAASVDASGLQGGTIQFRGKQITLNQGSQVETSTLGNGTGGTLVLIADGIMLDGSTADNSGDSRLFPTSLSSDNRGAGQVPSTLTIQTGQLSVSRGARISASNTGQGLGSGGNILVEASDLVELSGTGRSQGGIRSSAISVQNRSLGRAGTLTVNSRRVLIRDGAELSAATFGDGDGGTLTVQATERVELRGTSADGQRRSGLVAGVGNPQDILSIAPSVPISATGKGGNLSITTGQLRVSLGAVVEVSSRSSANTARGAGSLNMRAGSILLDSQGAIVAETVSGQGGNIDITLQNPLLLRNQSRISATAGTADRGGNGGNITLAAPFIIAIPTENSDITANAYSGSGGRVDINTQSLLGIQYRPRLTRLSDITASSKFGQQGTVTINGLDIDPSRGLNPLPTTTTIPQPSQGCKSNSPRTQAEFFTSGRGGQRQTPEDPLSAMEILDDLRIPDTIASNVASQPILEATHWSIGPSGNISIIANANQTLATPHCRLYDQGQESASPTKQRLH
jgi:filamentous hemagglutinin family protein